MLIDPLKLKKNKNKLIFKTLNQYYLPVGITVVVVVTAKLEDCCVVKPIVRPIVKPIIIMNITEIVIIKILVLYLNKIKFKFLKQKLNLNYNY